MSSPDIAAADRKAIFGRDLLASIVVFLVALPLCMGISIASGMPPTAGIITGIIGGMVVGFLAGSPLQVSGPAAGLSVLVLQFVQAEGAAMLGVVVLFAGVLQLVAGLAKLGQWFRAVSPAVIHGMLAGIGVLILASQFHVMLDFKPVGTGIQNLLGIPAALISAVDAHDAHLTAGEIGLLTIVTIVLWGWATPKSWRIVPAPLVGVLVGMAAAALFGLGDIQYINVPNNIWSVTVWPTTEKLMRLAEPTILVSAISIAFIASAETLLCATAVDQMHRGPRTKYDRELSSHGVWLLLFASALPFTLRYVPVSALAALLVYTGYKLAYPKAVPELLKFGKSEVFIYAVTIVVIVATNLLTGVLVGLCLSLLKLLYVFSHLVVRREENPGQNRTDLYLSGAATMIRLPLLAAELEKLKPNSHVHVHINELDYMDHACIDLLTNWDRQHATTGGSLTIEWDELSRKYHQRRGTKRKAVSSSEPSDSAMPIDGAHAASRE
jgi:MFS superfamily sulfate permease-like transporter